MQKLIKLIKTNYKVLNIIAIITLVCYYYCNMSYTRDGFSGGIGRVIKKNKKNIKKNIKKNKKNIGTNKTGIGNNKKVISEIKTSIGKNTNSAAEQNGKITINTNAIANLQDQMAE